MALFQIGVNMEFVRSADKPFAWGVAKAAELGYRFIEPMVHWGRELLSEAGYFHSVSMLDDPLAMRRICERHGVQLSGLSAHTPLAKPEISVVYLTQAIRFAAEAGAPVINTDEGPPHDFTGEALDHQLIQYVLTHALRAAEPRGIRIGLEQHQLYSRTPDGLDRLYKLVASPALGINFDTGNALLCGHDPYQWLTRVRDRVIHVHAKDIDMQQVQAEGGKVTGTPVGCACGQGVIDWEQILAILRPLDRPICLSVECGTIDQAADSLDHLRKLL